MSWLKKYCVPQKYAVKKCCKIRKIPYFPAISMSKHILLDKPQKEIPLVLCKLQLEKSQYFSTVVGINLSHFF